MHDELSVDELEMNVKNATGGAMLATAVAIAFFAGPARAADADGSGNEMPVICMGGNSCKAQSACKSFDHGCDGQNSCKGKGYILLPEKECKTKGGKVARPEDVSM